MLPLLLVHFIFFLVVTSGFACDIFIFFSLLDTHLGNAGTFYPEVLP